MKKGSVITIKDGKGMQVNCRKGDLWITESRSGDIHLKEGEDYSISGNGKTVVQALSSSRLEIG